MNIRTMNWNKNYRRYGKQTTSHDLFKFLVCIFMTIDHIGLYLFPDELIFRAFGRIGVPMWFFFAGYTARLGLLNKELLFYSALLVIVDIILGEPILPINVLLSILLCRWFVNILIKKNIGCDVFEIVLINIVFLFFLLPTYLIFEYGTLAILFAYLGYLTKKKSAEKVLRYLLYYLCALFIFMQEFSFGFQFSFYERIIIWGGLSTTCVFLYNYKIATYKFADNYFSKVVKYVGRNTLYYYFLHLVVLLLMKHYLFEEVVKG